MDARPACSGGTAYEYSSSRKLVKSAPSTSPLAMDSQRFFCGSGISDTCRRHRAGQASGGRHQEAPTAAPGSDELSGSL